MATPDLIQIDVIPRVRTPKPSWLRAKAPMGENYHSLKKLARGLNLHTVCESAQCPNIGECWNHKTATFMLLGNTCTRRCGFCAVPKGRPEAIDFDEPRRVAEAVEALGLKFAVVTDLGYMPPNVKEQLRRCDALLIESNHDLEMLRNGPYPWTVKQRVMSRVGHLSNSAVAEFFENDYDGHASHVVLAHLSEQNNHPELARESAWKALRGRMNLFQSASISLAHQDRPLQPLTLG